MSATPQGAAFRINQQPIQNNNNSIHASDLSILRAMGVLVSSNNTAAIAGQRQSEGQEVTSEHREYQSGQPHAKKRFPPPMKTGGIIKKTGVYTLHKGEVVVPANRVKSVDMALKNDKKKPLKK